MAHSTQKCIRTKPEAFFLRFYISLCFTYAFLFAESNVVCHEVFMLLISYKFLHCYYTTDSEIFQVLVNKATHSTCPVIGKKSTGRILLS